MHETNLFVQEENSFQILEFYALGLFYNNDIIRLRLK